MASTSESKAGFSIDDFHIVRTLGEGAVGTVLLASYGAKAIAEDDDAEDNMVALKVVMTSKLSSHGPRLRQVAMEMEVLSSLSTHPSPFLPSLLSHFAASGCKVFVLDYFPGGDLHTLQNAQSPRRFSEPTARFYFAEVLLALDHLHRLGYVYRDLKPENVVLRASGHVVLVDFDLCANLSMGVRASAAHLPSPSALGALIANILPQQVQCFLSSSFGKMKEKLSDLKKVLYKESTKVQSHDSNPDRRFSLVGTEECIAPEMLGNDGYGFAIDWWTLGIFLYELLCGHTPYKGSNSKETYYNILNKEPRLSEEWSPAVCDLIKGLLVKDPRNRLGSQDGASEIMCHEFFNGICWEELPHLSRPPCIPGNHLQSSGRSSPSSFNYQCNAWEGDSSRNEGDACVL